MSEEDILTARTLPALGESVIRKLETASFYICGCGAVGSIFADMLVRTGATNLTLVDGDKVAVSNLNRCPSFVLDDKGKKKTAALKSRLEAINPDVHIKTVEEHFRPSYSVDSEEPLSHKPLRSTNYGIIAMDENKSRHEFLDFCQRIDDRIRTISVGVEIRDDGDAAFEVIWKPQIGEHQIENKGYGEHGSYASVVIEASSAGMGMLLARINDPECQYRYIRREYKGFVPSGEWQEPPGAENP